MLITKCCPSYYIFLYFIEIPVHILKTKRKVSFFVHLILRRLFVKTGNFSAESKSVDQTDVGYIHGLLWNCCLSFLLGILSDLENFTTPLICINLLFFFLFYNSLYFPILVFNIYHMLVIIFFLKLLELFHQFARLYPLLHLIVDAGIIQMPSTSI